MPISAQTGHGPGMNQTGKSPWRVVAGATAALIVGNGPMMQFTFGVFLKPVASALHLSRGGVSAALSIGLLGTALGAPFAGRAMDRWGGRRVILLSVLAFALMLALNGLLASGAATLFLLSGVMGVAAAGQTPVGYARAIVAHFDCHRGLALGIAMTGVGLGTVAVPMLAAALIGRLGWRLAYVGLGVTLLIVAVPAVLLCIQKAEPGTPRTASRLENLWRTPAFVKLAIGFTLVAFAGNGTIAHVVPMLTDAGLSPQRAAAMLGWMGVALICGRLAAGWILDRSDPLLVTAAFFTAVMIGVALLGLGSTALAGAALFLIGLGLGAEIDLLAFLVGRAFGTANFGSLYGTLFAMFMVGSSIGPLAIGLGYDAFSSYRPGLMAMGLLLIAAIGLTLSMRCDLPRQEGR